MSHDVGGTSAALLAPIELSRACQDEVEEAPDGLAAHLDCTGLYKDADGETLAPGVELFTPVYPLWTDAAQKYRWIYLPKGSAIDAKDPSAWQFPIGTRLWKEFQNSSGTRRVETRVFIKTADDDWSYATYLWDDAGKRATREDGGKNLVVDGQTYGVPSRTQCNECHVGRRDRVMGFDAVTLGIPGGDNHEGLTLEQLVSSKRLKNFDGETELKIGPDPQSAEARALGWMHNNCGVTCHNSNPNSKAYSTGMFLILDPEQLDGRSTAEFTAIKTTVGQNAFSLQWQGQMRITPGAPDESLLYKLITQRGDPKQQMPPLGTTITDDANTEIVREWIDGLQAEASPD